MDRVAHWSSAFQRAWGLKRTDKRNNYSHKYDLHECLERDDNRHPCDSVRLMGIELIYLPPYSRKLNLIERLWKFFKRKWLYSVQYPSFEAFSEGIMGGLERAHLDYSSELNSLLTLRFQTLPNLKKSA